MLGLQSDNILMLNGSIQYLYNKLDTIHKEYTQAHRRAFYDITLIESINKTF
jgi:hypothetical protein